MDATDKAAFLRGIIREIEDFHATQNARVREVIGGGAYLHFLGHAGEIPLDVMEHARLPFMEVERGNRNGPGWERVGAWTGGNAGAGFPVHSVEWLTPDTRSEPPRALSRDWRVRSGLREQADIEAEDALRRNLAEENE
jgi:hypothetical protein